MNLCNSSLTRTFHNTRNSVKKTTNFYLIAVCRRATVGGWEGELSAFGIPLFPLHLSVSGKEHLLAICNAQMRSVSIAFTQGQVLPSNHALRYTRQTMRVCDEREIP